MTMTFDNWLEQVGLGHCRQPLLDNGIDFDVAFDLTLDALLKCGLTVGDGLRLLKALNAIRTDPASGTAQPAPDRPRAPTGGSASAAWTRWRWSGRCGVRCRTRRCASWT